MSVEYGGTHEARESAARRLGVLSIILTIAIYFLLLAALKSALSALLALLNVPLALIGGVAAVWLANPVLSVSSLVGFVTVTGFVLRNGILLLQRYRELTDEGMDLSSAIREGSLERMAPILMTSLTTVLGLVPIIIAGDKPGSELLAPLAVVQFGGILSAGMLNLMVLPAAAMVAGKIATRRIKPMKAIAILSVTFSAMAIVSGCKSYEAKPIDWDKESEDWTKVNTLRFNSLDDVAIVALIGNPDLNRLRIARANSEKVARETGWWEDPEIEFDVMRIVRSANHPFLGGGALNFSIPLSGVPKLERKTQEAYTKAAADEITARECEVASAARMAAVRLTSSQNIARMLDRFESDELIAKAFTAAEKLTAEGELSTTDLTSAKLRRHSRIHQLRDAQNAADEAESELRKLLGVSPNTILDFAEYLDHGCIHTSMPPERAAIDYTKHPKVQAALHRLKGGEEALKTEIRRQYPELKIGPAFSNEEGQGRIGLVAGATLPLWNRNRRGIAQAEGERDELNWDAISLWREITLDVHAARRKLKNLIDHQPDHRSRSVTEANQLLKAGELDILAYLSAREEILEAELAEVEWKTGICLASEELNKNNAEVKYNE
jgi:hypothetical protein